MSDVDQITKPAVIFDSPTRCAPAAGRIPSNRDKRLGRTLKIHPFRCRSLGRNS